MRPIRPQGFTIIELLVAVAIVGILASMVMPLAEMTVRRQKETELRHALREIRNGIDAYRQAIEDGRIQKTMDSSGYPPSLEKLVEGVEDLKDPRKRRIYFLRRVPRDPLASDPNLSDSDTWGKRSYASPPDDPKEGDDVFDVYSLNRGKGLNGIPYRQW